MGAKAFSPAYSFQNVRAKTPTTSITEPTRRLNESLDEGDTQVPTRTGQPFLFQPMPASLEIGFCLMRQDRSPALRLPSEPIDN